LFYNFILCLVGSIVTNQPQQFRQFQYVTNPNNGNNTSNSTNQTVQQLSQSLGAQQAQATIRKVSSTSNLGTFQQKVHVLNRPGIQIVQSNPSQRVGSVNTSTSQFQQVFQQHTSKISAQTSLLFN
jgi:hypothetical protein